MDELLPPNAVALLHAGITCLLLTGRRGQFADFSDGSAAEGRRYSTDSDSKSGKPG